MTLVFQTDGLIPLPAFTTFGLNAKLNDNPIGFFGTGLKYAVAITLRLGGTFRLDRGLDEYEFYTSPQKFRGKDFQDVRMRKRTTLGKWGRSIALPFTLELGKNWEPWMAVRELESNTRDEEGGSSDYYDSESPAGMSGLNVLEPAKDITRIVIDCPHMETAFNDGTIFFDKADRKLIHEGYYVQIWSGQNDYVYMNGIRVYTPEQPSKFTYNIKQNLELTEDRTPKSIFMVSYHLLEALKKMKDNDRLDELFGIEDGKFFETRLDFDQAGRDTSPEYRNRLTYAVEYGGGTFSRATANHRAVTTVDRTSRHPVAMSIQDWADMCNGRQVSEAQREKIISSLNYAKVDLRKAGVIE
jgi:hypothetical protein